jgi:hypothetical protein
MLPVQTAKSSCKLPKDASLAGSTTKKKEETPLAGFPK